jgi:AmmeMemoRadiSam system protein B
VLLGAVHVPFVSAPTVYDGHAWDSPLGPVAVDDLLRSALLSLGGPFLRPGSHAHEDEHALEVQIPFIRQLLPAASILPIAVPPDERAAALGRLVGEAVTADPRAVAVVASSDLTHYGRRYGFAPAGAGPGALEFGRRNDQLLLDRALALDPPGVLDEALSHHNACGPGALAACCAAMQVLGATERRLLQRTTSYDVKPDGDPGFFVGYASILFGTGKS